MMEKTMQESTLSGSRSSFIPQSGGTIDVPAASGELYRTLQQEVEIGVQVLERDGAEMAVTFFQSALQKLTVDQPFYDHLVYNLLVSYKLLIEKLLKNGARTSGSYRPLIYILQGGFPGGCPPGTGNLAWNWQMSSWDNDGTAMLNSVGMRFLPLNVPLHLFVDSTVNDANGSGPYTIQMQDVTVTSEQCQNPIDRSGFFVRQHYLDFLNREPEQSGLDAWLNVMSHCSDVLNDPNCDRIPWVHGFCGVPVQISTVVLVAELVAT
jgi:hypothetical protein